MLFRIARKKHFIYLLIHLLCWCTCFTATAQLTADFSIDKTGGCAPLQVSFTNKTTGASAAATYHWDFGNGNTSPMANPGAIYTDEKTYLVTLTVKEGTQTATKTRTVTVYQQPVADFNLSAVKGCLPFGVTFTSTATPGSGSISSYAWDFGDGATQTGFSGTVAHTYNIEQLATVSLTVTNSFGCFHTVQKKDLVKVIPPIRSDFTADKRVLCKETDPVQLTNTSSGPGTLSYLWDFGDGNTSTAAAPSHAFNKKGIYTVKLTVTSSEGCTAVNSQSNYLNVASYKTDFTTPQLVCSGTSTYFSSTSSPVPTTSRWRIDGIEAYYYYTNFLVYTFNTAGNHTVQLVNTFETCPDSLTKQVTVSPTPELQGFEMVPATLCGAPVVVNVKDTTPGAVKWDWLFNYSRSSNQPRANTQSATNTYTVNDYYAIYLQVTNAAGCSNSTVKYITINPPAVFIQYLQSASIYGNRSCGANILKLGYSSSEALTQFTWQFDDGTTSTDPQPVHTFNKSGVVNLVYKTINGCTGTATYPVTVDVRPKADFKINGSPVICGNTPTTFTSLSTGTSSVMYWAIDGYGVGGYNNNFTYQFLQPGKHTIRLIVENGTCRDTMNKVDYVEVVYPFPKINTATNTCNGLRDTVTFTQSSRGAQTWHWDFGDGGTADPLTDLSSLTHRYAKTGTYKVVLTTTNGACTVRDSLFAYVLLKQKPVLTLSQPAVCIDGSIAYTISGLEQSPGPTGIDKYYFNKWQYGDGSGFTGSYGYYNYLPSIPYSATLSGFQNNRQNLRAILTEPFFGCTDTSNYAILKVNGPQAGYAVTKDKVCFKDPVILTDTSNAATGTGLQSWFWSFGDGQVLNTTQGGTISHQYDNPGSYYVSLKVTDNTGCSAVSQYGQYVEVNGPKASFSASGTNVPLNTTVYFYNNTNNYGSPNTQYKWDFGNGATSNGYYPSYTYTVPGTYTVKLIATNPVSGCSSEATQTIVVKLFNSNFSFNVSNITGKSCAPVLVQFTNTSQNYTSISWDFGDGITAGNVNYASHIYNKPGRYIVTLYVYAPNGIKGTYIDSVLVEQPEAVVQADAWEGCEGKQVTLWASINNAGTYTWDFGDGNIRTTTDSFNVNTYLTPGIYQPRLLVTDAKGCTGLATLANKINIHDNPVINITPVAPVICKGSAVQLHAGGPDAYQWSPATGLNRTDVVAPVATPLTNITYTVQATSNLGCRSRDSVKVTVQPPTTVQLITDTFVCAGNTIQLTANGTDEYQWINTTDGLSNTQIANPLATPPGTITYTVKGTDRYHCFTDEATVLVKVNPLPVVEAGANLSVFPLTEVPLIPAGSADIVDWNWSPATYLNCTHCVSPVSIPKAETLYTLTVTNNNGCKASDSVRIKMICEESKVRIPNGFSPDGNGKNDVFMVKGISIIKHLIIYNRWGEKVFDRSNFIANDRAACWNGTYKGQPAPAGTYVYFIDMECPSGGSFTRQGTVVLIR